MCERLGWNSGLARKSTKSATIERSGESTALKQKLHKHGAYQHHKGHLEKLPLMFHALCGVAGHRGFDVNQQISRERHGKAQLDSEGMREILSR
jgi:hypothetical protein